MSSVIFIKVKTNMFLQLQNRQNKLQLGMSLLLLDSPKKQTAY